MLELFGKAGIGKRPGNVLTHRRIRFLLVGARRNESRGLLWARNYGRLALDTSWQRPSRVLDEHLRLNKEYSSGIGVIPSESLLRPLIQLILEW